MGSCRSLQSDTLKSSDVTVMSIGHVLDLQYALDLPLCFACFWVPGAMKGPVRLSSASSSSSCMLEPPEVSDCESPSNPP